MATLGLAQVATIYRNGHFIQPVGRFTEVCWGRSHCIVESKSRLLKYMLALFNLITYRSLKALDKLCSYGSRFWPKLISLYLTIMGYANVLQSLHQIRRYPAPYISKAAQKATPSNILQPFIPHCFPLQSPYINSRPFISSPHYFYSSPIRFRICPTPAQPTSILTRVVFPADQQSILNDQFYVEEMPEEIVIVVKLIYSDRTHST